jgi:hypothetical protein
VLEDLSKRTLAELRGVLLREHDTETWRRELDEFERLIQRYPTGKDYTFDLAGWRFHCDAWPRYLGCVAPACGMCLACSGAVRRSHRRFAAHASGLISARRSRYRFGGHTGPSPTSKKTHECGTSCCWGGVGYVTVKWPNIVLSCALQ